VEVACGERLEPLCAGREWRELEQSEGGAHGGWRRLVGGLGEEIYSTVGDR
jgi:hypothetical protein